MSDQEFIKNQKEIIASSFEQAKSYSNIIIFGGYAGLFTIWNFTKGELLSWQVVTVGLLTILSLFFFVSSELFGLWLRTTQNTNLMNELNEAEKMDQYPIDYAKLEMARTLKFLKIWPYFFYPAVLSALGATLVLIYSFIKILLCGNTP